MTIVQANVDRVCATCGKVLAPGARKCSECDSYQGECNACGLPIPRVTAGAATVLASIGVSSSRWTDLVPVDTAVVLDAVLMSAFVVLAALTMMSWRGDRAVLARAGAAIFPLLYLGLPIGALVALRLLRGREALFLLMLTVMISDTAQYYSGRAFGRRPLAPAISPKKTVEGAVGGFVFGALTLAAIGVWWLPDMPIALRGLVLLLGGGVGVHLAGFHGARGRGAGGR